MVHFVNLAISTLGFAVTFSAFHTFHHSSHTFVYDMFLYGVGNLGVYLMAKNFQNIITSEERRQ